MNTLYNVLQWCFRQQGWSVAPFAENTLDAEERTLTIAITDLHPVQQGFNILEATITFTFLNGHTWEDNAHTLTNCLTSFIPMDERQEEHRTLVDYSSMLTLLDIPEYTDILTEQDEDTGTTTHSVTVTFPFVFTN